jgi:hypothetical protein
MPAASAAGPQHAVLARQTSFIDTIKVRQRAVYDQALVPDMMAARVGGVADQALYIRACHAICSQHAAALLPLQNCVTYLKLPSEPFSHARQHIKACSL